MSSSPPQLRLCLFLNYCAYAIMLNSVGIAVLQAQRSFGVTVAAAATLAFYKGAGILTGALVAGAFLKRIGYKRAMLLSLGASAAVLGAVPLFASFTALKLVFLVTGLCYGLMKVALYSTIGLVTDGKKEHASLLSFVEAFYKIGSLLTFIVFAAFTDDADARSTSWAHAYYLLAGLMLVALALLLPVKLDESRVRAAGAVPLHQPFVDMLRLVVTPVALVLGLLVACCIVTEHGFINLLPTFNHKVFKLTPSLGIQLAGLYAIWSVIGRLTLGFVLKRIAWFPALTVCTIGAMLVLIAGLLAVGAAPAATIARWQDAPLAVFLIPVAGLFVSPIFPGMHSAALTSLPVHRHNTLASLSVVFSSTSGAFGTPLLGLVFQHYGGLTAMIALLGPMLLMMAGIVLLRRVTSSAAPTAAPASPA